MKDRPILFSAPMVKALLAGTKTQTRRIIRVQPALATDKWFNDSGGTGMWMPSGPAPNGGTRQTHGWLPCPYGVAGDRLWVRETMWRNGGYVATDPANFPNEGKKPSIFMERAESRITLEITDIRVERVNDISEADAIAEGIPPFKPSPSVIPRLQYCTLFESINGKGSWLKEPWVWVVVFKRI